MGRDYESSTEHFKKVVLQQSISIICNNSRNRWVDKRIAEIGNIDALCIGRCTDNWLVFQESHLTESTTIRWNEKEYSCVKK